MRKLIVGAAALLGLFASTSTASAQHHKRNVIAGSGNGAGNTVVARSHGGPVPFFAPGFGGFGKK